MSTNIPYMTGQLTDLPMEEVFKILSGQNKNEENVMSMPPILPKGGEVFLYQDSSDDPKHEMDFRFDQYRWVSKGSNLNSRRSNLPEVMKRYYYLKDPNGSEKQTLNGFKKHVYCLRKSTQPKKLYIIHYIGNEGLYHLSSHGNAVTSRRPFIASMKHTMTKIEEAVKILKSPARAYSHVLGAETVSTEHIAVDSPRNLKQVQNVSYKQRKEKQICNDEYFALVELSTQIDGFITRLQTVPEFTVSFGHPSIIQNANKLISLSNQDSSLPQLISYDTTFSLGDFYLSPLVMRNVILKDDPIFPVAFLLHSHKFMKHHEDFLSHIIEKLDVSKMSGIPFVTDRERGIVRAIEKRFPQIKNVHCTNHILRDVTTWLKSHGGTKEDLKVLRDHLRQLIDSKSIQDYSEKYEKYHQLWSCSFREYFDKNLKEEIPEHAATFVTNVFAVFRKDRAATNNISESFNKMIKEEVGWKELPADTMVLAMYHMQCYFHLEFERAYCGLGKYELKEKFEYLRKNAANVHFPKFYQLDKIIEQIKNSVYIPVKWVEKKPNYRMTQKAMARYVLDNGGVCLCAQASTFTVQDFHGSKVQAVKIVPKPVCSCISTGLCYHIIAVQMGIGFTDIVDNQSYSLSLLMKRKRGRTQKSGRKKPRVGDFDYTVYPAPDSALCTTKDERKAMSDMTVHFPASEFEDILDGQTSPWESTPVDECQKANTLPLETGPWNSTPTQAQLQTMKKGKPGLMTSLEPEKWLCDEVIEEAIMNFICEKKLTSKILVCPVYIYQSVARCNYDMFYRFLDRKAALNHDLLLVPYNTDIMGSGQHWCLGVIVFTEKKIIIIDSCINTARAKENGKVLLSIAAACHQLAGITFDGTAWTMLLCNDAVQQLNTYDCGVFTVLNAYSVVSGQEYKHIISPYARTWIGVNVVKHSMCSCRRRHWRTPILRKSYRKMHGKLMEIESEVPLQVQPLVQYLLKLVDSNESDLSTCPATLCLGNTAPDKLVFCVVCRQWFHVTCCKERTADLPAYFTCTGCSPQ